MGRSTKVKHHNAKVQAKLLSFMRDQQRLWKKLVAANNRLKAKESALLACVQGQGDGIRGYSKVIQAVQSCLEDMEESKYKCFIDFVAQALSYDVQVYDIMHHLSFSDSSKSSGDAREAELRTSKCLQAAWRAKAGQQVLVCPDTQQLLQSFQELSKDVVLLSSQHNLMTQQLQVFADLESGNLTSAASKTDVAVATPLNLHAASGTGNGAQFSRSSSSNTTGSTTGVTSLDEALEELMGLILLTLSLDDALMVKVALTNLASNQFQPPPAERWDHIAAVLAHNMQPQELLQHSAAVEADRVHRTARGNRMVELLQKLQQLLKLAPDQHTTLSGSSCGSPKEGAAGSTYNKKQSEQDSASSSSSATVHEGHPQQPHLQPHLQQPASEQHQGIGVAGGGLHEWWAELLELLEEFDRVLVQCRLSAHTLEWYFINTLSLEQLCQAVVLSYPWVPQPVMILQAIYKHHDSSSAAEGKTRHQQSKQEVHL